MTWIVILIYVFLGISLTFNGLGAVAMHRFPDMYTRLHGATKTTTFGTIFASLAVIAYAAYNAWMYPHLEGKYFAMCIHTLIALLALIVTNPTGAHAIARGAYRGGYKPEYVVVDYYGKHEEAEEEKEEEEEKKEGVGECSSN